MSIDHRRRSRRSHLYARLVLVCLALIILPMFASSRWQEASFRWEKSRAFPAQEAKQAAAAAGDVVYVIANAQVAIYDRESGERLKLARVAAKHLNSGFFWKGRLYCAHSNYPATPEKSEIKVIDPETTRLETFKDFGEYGGSLTWAVYDEGHWWCNFARYGAINHETFLVKFDPDWQELGRWTYPPEVIDRLNGMSLSGGIWREGVLLATNHDDPILFRMRLPEEGSVLELLGIDSAPFTGQGFAIDPMTGGLVGINRSRREIVFASPPQR